MMMDLVVFFFKHALITLYNNEDEEILNIEMVTTAVGSNTKVLKFPTIYILGDL